MESKGAGATKDSSDGPSSPKRNKTEYAQKGLLLIVDRISNENNTKALTDLFKTDLGCEVKELKIKGEKHWAEVKDEAKNVAERDYRFVVIFVAKPRARVSEEEQMQIFRRYFEEFSNNDTLDNTPKLFIQHVLVAPQDDEGNSSKSKPRDENQSGYKVPPSSMYIRSIVVNATKENRSYNHIQSSFMDSMRRIVKSDARHLGIIDLITKVLEDRELGDFFNLKDHEILSESKTPGIEQADNKEKDKQVYEEVIFSSNLKNSFRLLPDDDSSRSSKPSTRSIHAERNFPVSKIDMKKLLSLKIELKEQKIPDYLLDQHYYMDHKRRGFCILINQTGERAGAYVDELRLLQLFQHELLFETRVIRNKTHEEIEDEINQIVNEINESHQCLFVFLMAHGCQYKHVKTNGNGTPPPSPTEQHDMAADTDPATDKPKPPPETSSKPKNGTNGDHVFYDIFDKAKKSNYIFSSFGGDKCPHLENKPKVFVLQTCFGAQVMNPHGDTEPEKCDGKEQKDRHVKRTDMYMRHDDGGNGNGRNKDLDQDMNGQPLTTNIGMKTTGGLKAAHETSDTIWLNATLPGFRSHRNILYGTQLIQSLDQAFRQKAAEFDITHLITAVISLVSKKEFHAKERQQPVTKEHTLKSFLFLNPGFIREEDCSLPTTVKPTPITGSVIWSAITDTSRNLILVNVDHHGISQIKLVTLREGQQEIIELKYANGSTETPATNGNGALNHITNGIMLDDNRHLVVADKNDKCKKALIVSVNKDDKTWKIDEELPVPVNYPIAVCAINIDGFGILSGEQETSNAQFEVYKRSPFLQPQDKQAKKQPIQTEISLRLDYGKISYFDKIYYKKTKLFILNYYECTVSQFNMNGVQEFVVGKPAVPRGSLIRGELLNPCAVIGNSDKEKYRCTQLVVPCCNAIHTASIELDEKDADKPWKVTWNDPKPVHEMENIDKIDSIWYDKKNVLIIKDELIDCTKIDVNENTFNEINTTPKKDLKDGWLRQTMWRTEANELVLGGAQATDITLLDPAKQEIKYTVNPMKHGRVISGLSTKPGTHVIVAGDDPDQVRRKQNGINGNGVPKQWIVDMDTEKKEISRTRGVNHRKRNLYPISLFTVDGDKYGVLCAEKDVNQYAYIELRKKDENVLKWTLRVHHKNVSVNDSVCVDQKGEFYVSSFKTGKVQKFDKHGKLMALLGNGNNERISRGLNEQCNLEQPYKIFLAKDCKVVVQCINAMYKYKDGEWKQVSGFSGMAWDMCCIGKKVYTIYKDEFITWDIVDSDAQQPSTSSQSKRPRSPQDSPSSS